MKLYVSNLSVRVNENDLIVLLERFGQVAEVEIKPDPASSTMIAAITMGSDEECYDAMNALNRQLLFGQPVKVSCISETKQNAW